MTRFVAFFLLFLMVINCGFLCSKKDKPADQNPAGNGIYVVYSTGMQHSNRIGTLWHDGANTELINRTSKVYLNDLAIAPNGDVYVTGCECTWSRYPLSPNQKDDSCRLVYWKNNVKQTLTTEPFSSITKLFVFVTTSGDVYMAGTNRSSTSGAGIIDLWKNGIVQHITNENTDSEAGSLYVNGNDVYIGGNQKPLLSINTTAKLWKNGVAQVLSGNTSYFDEVVAVQTSGSDVYAAVQEATTGWLSKNGVKQTQPSGIEIIRDIFVSGSDIYVLGKKSYTSTSVWKNGTLLYDLSYTGVSDYYDGGQRIFVKDGDVYVAGTSIISGAENAVLWKNGTIINTLSQLTYRSLATAEGIIVK